MSSSKYLKNKLSIQKRKKEFFVLFIFALLIVSTVYYLSYIQYSPITPSDFPRINIQCENELNKEDYIDCTFELESDDNSDNILPMKSKIKIRGSFNAKMPKKGYRIELSNQKSLLGMRTDDDWQLFAMFLDIPHIRIKLSFDLWRTLLPTNPTAILPKSKYVSLYINGEYQGLYLLAEKNDRRLFGLDDPQNNINSSLIFQAGSHKTNFYEYSKGSWDQDWPNEYDGYFIMDEIMTDLVSFIRNSNEEVFFDSETGIYSKFDKLNLIDFYIFNFFILHKDFWSQNYFLVRNQHPSGLYFLIPWDFDASFGQYLNRKYDFNENPESDIISRNFLYNRLLGNEEFILDCKNRWFQLREELWTEEFILDMVLEMYEDIRSILEIDTKMWYPWIFEVGWEKEVNEAVNYLFEWIPERLEYCDSYFSELLP